MKRVLLAAFVNLCLFQPVFGQVRSPKHESALHHILAPHRDVDNLEQRFDDLKCALVLIERGQTIGTGFYISDDGDVATASHVLGDRTFSRNPNGSIQVNIAVPPEFFVTNNKGERISIPARLIDVNADSWLSDVARIKTGTKTSCRLQQVDDRQSRPGQHLITLGFPGLSFETLTLYTGIMSARLTTNLPSEFLDTGEAIKPPNEFIRVQMPISPGLSGAPSSTMKIELLLWLRPQEDGRKIWITCSWPSVEGVFQHLHRRRRHHLIHFRSVLIWRA